MSKDTGTQMTVRLSGRATRFIDAQVADGAFTSRAQYLDWLVGRAAQRDRTPVDFSARTEVRRTDPNPEMAEFRERQASRNLAHLDG